MIDVNREKDGQLTRYTPNLAAPSLTYDVLSVTGQGMMGQYRPYRNDIGASFEEYASSKSAGGGVGVEVGLGNPLHLGLNGEINFSQSWSGKWQNLTTFAHDFIASHANIDFENVYFKSTGELTAEDDRRFNEIVGGDGALKLDLTGLRTSPQLTDVFSDGNDNPNNTILSNSNRDTVPRKPRGTSILPLTNSQLTNLNEYNIQYYPSNILGAKVGTYKTDESAMQSLDRGTRTGYDNTGFSITNHIGGISAVNNEGMRYVYGIPAYNNKHVEATFTVPGPGVDTNSYCTHLATVVSDNGVPRYHVTGTDEYNHRTNMPPYAHSYLLTSILGPDYVDVDNNGPSENDLGYWVKFNYVKVTDGYKWRAPYNSTQANYQGGYQSNQYDDKASYMYGEREVWYLASAETKTHKAIFYMSGRHDGVEAACELGTSGTPTNKSYKLDSIQLFIKKDYDNSSNPKPLQTVRFNYDYSLCPSVLNNDGLPESEGGTDLNTNHGKLTLKSVCSTYENSIKGALSPYYFQYGNFANGNGGTSNSNPGYDPFAYDRWGNFKPDGSECDKVLFPYVNQNMDKYERDSSVVAWNLTDVHTPSGSDIHVSYESKDYAYVQDKVAMRMYPIVSLGDISNPNQLYNWTWPTSTRHAESDQDRKIYFPLKYPIPVSYTQSQIDSVMALYMDDTKQLYFKVHAPMKKASQSQYNEYISGYLDVLYQGVDVGSAQSKDGAGQNYIRGYVVVDFIKKNGTTNINYHPISYLILQSLKLNLPQFAYESNLDTQNPGAHGAGMILNMLKSIGAAFASIAELFDSYYNMSTDVSHQWASQLDLTQSYIRLNCPDRIKYGGGARVRQVQIADNWDQTTGETAAQYGTTYDYTTVENGATISSGVATYEPQIGGEENALRYAKNYPQKISVTTEEQLYYEYPINEGYYPAPSIGYSKVTVRSLNTANILASKTTGVGYGSTGVTENDFYTAKDYPVVATETSLFPSVYSKSMKYINLPIPLPGLGTLGWDIMAASQGYCIELNDMHGKQKAVYNYGLDANGRQTSTAVSSVQYYYNDSIIQYAKPGTNQIYTARILKNEVPVLLNDPNPQDLTKAQIAKKLVGVDYEMFTDQRQSKTWSAGGGLDFNLELLITPFPLPCPIPWPNVSYQENDLSVAVTNKIIQRSGILTKTVATDGQSTVTTNNRVYDQYTGRPLLTTVNNDFNDLIWAYHIPADLKFNQMGPAYRNIGLTLNVPSDSIINTGIDTVYQLAGFSASKYLVPGDEFIMAGGKKGVITQSNGADTATFVLTNSNSGAFYLNTATSTTTSNYTMYLVRSGRRNQLQTDAGVITALKDPTCGRVMNTCYDTLYVATGYSPAGETCLSADFIADFLSAISEVINGYGGQAYFPLTDALFAGDTYYTNQLLAAGFTGVQVDINTINFISINGHNCQWAFYYSPDIGLFRPLEIGLIRGVSDYSTANTLPYTNAYGSVIFPADTLGYTLMGTFYVGVTGSLGITQIPAAIYQSPGNCVCNQVTPSTTTTTMIVVPDTVIGIDSVINATANVYTDNWTSDFTNLRFENDPNYYMEPYYLQQQNGYQNGSQGIWRDWMNFTYYTDRRQNPTTINTRRDGTFLMSMFNWQQPLVNHCDSNWVRVKEVTKYNGYNYEVENRDPLGIYSAALYSYSGKLPIAVGANTHNSEFGFEGFEEYQSATVYNQYQNATGNIDITTQVLGISYGSHFTNYNDLQMCGISVPAACYLFPSNSAGINNNTTYDNCTIDANFNTLIGSSGVGHITRDGFAATSFPNTGTSANLSAYNFSVIPIFDPFGGLGTFFSGLLEIPFTQYVPSSVNYIDSLTLNGDAAISDTKAHTGVHSLKVIKPCSFSQSHLSFLSKDEQYQFSAWVSRDDANANVSSYGPSVGGASNACRVEIMAYDEAGGLLGVVGRFYPAGSMINKWQKVEGAFSLVYPTAKYISIAFYPGLAGPGYTTTAPAYFDDIRIFPSRGNMKSYVYNNTDYKLKAVLDDNNYATLYYYDEEGQLYLTKQETERGHTYGAGNKGEYAQVKDEIE